MLSVTLVTLTQICKYLIVYGNYNYYNSIEELASCWGPHLGYWIIAAME